MSEVFDSDRADLRPSTAAAALGLGIVRPDAADPFARRQPAVHLREQAGQEVAIGATAKRLFDIVAGSIILLAISPVLIAVTLLLLIEGGPVLFRHTRVGFGGRPFACLKFRSMVQDAQERLAAHLRNNPAAAAEWAERRKLRKDPRVTRVGAVLRATSLDELPQIFNVLRGEMSLVGPRPVVRAELDSHYGPAGIAAYLACRPGMTGLWQVSGRSDTTYGERVMLDSRYVRVWSFGLDMRILFATVHAVLNRRGAV